MPLNLNQVFIAGNLTSAVEFKQVGSSKVATFGIAINRKYKGNDGEMKEETTFVNVQAWARQAELCEQYLSKGRNVMIEGSLKFESWTGKDQSKRSAIKINAHRVHFIGTAESKPDPQYRDMSTQDNNPVDDSAPF